MLFFLALLFISLTGKVLAACPPGAIQGVKSTDCYLLIPEPGSWVGAEAKCRSRGGYLTSIGNAFVNKFLTEQAELFFIATSFWSGGKLNGSEWTWVDGSPLRYTNWKKGQPSNKNGCISVLLDTGEWTAQSCTSPKPYICKVSAETAKQSSTHVPHFTSVTYAPAGPYLHCQLGFTYVTSLNICLQVSMPDWWQNNQCTGNATYVSIHSSSANSAIADFAKAQLPSVAPWATAVWIGLHMQHRWQWEWTDHSKFKYSNWSASADHCTDSSKDCTVAMTVVKGSQYGQWTAYTGGVGPDASLKGGQPALCALPPYIAYPTQTSPTYESTIPPTTPDSFFPRCVFGFTYISTAHICLQVSSGPEWWNYNPGGSPACPYSSQYVSIHSASANRDIANFAVANLGTMSSWATVVWIGLHAPHSKWQWLDNSTYNYANWAPNGDQCTNDAYACNVAMLVNGTSPGQWAAYGGAGPDSGPTLNSGTEPALCTLPPNY